MPFGVPRSPEERAKRHQEIYGEGQLPPAVRRGLGPVMETIPEIIWSWLPAFPPVPPIPRWAAVNMRGAGRRLPR
ncbi:hypothetical protein ES703_115912 [subsurface metagenome]